MEESHILKVGFSLTLFKVSEDFLHFTLKYVVASLKSPVVSYSAQLGIPNVLATNMEHYLKYCLRRQI